MMEKIIERATETAKKIRKELKKAFPEVKFSVRSSSYSGGSSVDVNWEDGPMQEEVERVTEKFNSCSFDSMQDMKVTTGYEYKGKIYNGADYIFANRSLSSEYKQTIQEHAKEMFEDLNINDWTYQRKMIQAEEDMKGLNKAPVIEIQEEPEEIKPLAEVIDFNEKKAEKEFNKFTPEQKFKLIALKTICKMSYEHLEGVLERGLSIDDIFKGVANRCFKNEKAIRR
ncbi:MULTISPECIES: LPD29 domain-containing protein [Bacillus cereus group]|nr:LPD29 domain-containing protein [Bacillus cereus]